MPEHTIGTREEWQRARDELAKLEAEQAELDQKATEQRRQLPWVPVEKEYEFDTEEGKKTVAFDGRTQLLAYNIMFGPDYDLRRVPGLLDGGDELGATLVHLNHRDVTVICFSVRRSIGSSPTRSGWVGSFPTSRPMGRTFLRLWACPHARAGAGDSRGQGDAGKSARVARRGRQVGAKLEDGMRENPSLSPSRARTEPCTTPTPCRRPIRSSPRTASFLIKRTPKPEPEEPRAWRKDEYPD